MQEIVMKEKGINISINHFKNNNLRTKSLVNTMKKSVMKKSNIKNNTTHTSSANIGENSTETSTKGVLNDISTNIVGIANPSGIKVVDVIFAYSEVKQNAWQFNEKSKIEGWTKEEAIVFTAKSYVGIDFERFLKEVQSQEPTRLEMFRLILEAQQRIAVADGEIKANLKKRKGNLKKKVPHIYLNKNISYPRKVDVLQQNHSLQIDVDNIPSPDILGEVVAFLSSLNSIFFCTVSLSGNGAKGLMLVEFIYKNKNELDALKKGVYDWLELELKKIDSRLSVDRLGINQCMHLPNNANPYINRDATPLCLKYEADKTNGEGALIEVVIPKKYKTERRSMQEFKAEILTSKMLETSTKGNGDKAFAVGGLLNLFGIDIGIAKDILLRHGLNKEKYFSRMEDAYAKGSHSFSTQKFKLTNTVDLPPPIVTLEKGQYLTDVMDKIDFYSNQWLVASVGSGKSAMVRRLAHEIKVGLRKGFKIVIAVPTIALCDEFMEINELLKLSGAVPFDGKRKNIGARDKFIVVTYDSIEDLARQMDKLKANIKAEQFTLFVDEAHNLITERGYRNKAIDSLVKSFPLFRSHILMTATPLPTHDPILQKPEYVVIGKEFDGTKLYGCRMYDLNQKTNEVCKQVLKYHKEGVQSIVFNNLKEAVGENITYINFCKKYKLSYIFINTDTKVKDENAELVLRDKDISKYDVVFITSLLKEGVNLLLHSGLKSKSGKIYVAIAPSTGSVHPLSMNQISARARNSEILIVESYHPIKNLDEINKFTKSDSDRAFKWMCSMGRQFEKEATKKLGAIIELNKDPKELEDEVRSYASRFEYLKYMEFDNSNSHEPKARLSIGKVEYEVHNKEAIELNKCTYALGEYMEFYGFEFKGVFIGNAEIETKEQSIHRKAESTAFDRAIKKGFAELVENCRSGSHTIKLLKEENDTSGASGKIKAIFLRVYENVISITKDHHGAINKIKEIGASKSKLLRYANQVYNDSWRANHIRKPKDAIGGGLYELLNGLKVGDVLTSDQITEFVSGCDTIVKGKKISNQKLSKFYQKLIHTKM